MISLEPYTSGGEGVDATAGVQQWLDDIVAAEEIGYVPKGIYMIGRFQDGVQTIVQNFQVRRLVIVGDGSAVTIFKRNASSMDPAGSGARMIHLKSAGEELGQVVIRGLTFDGNRSNNPTPVPAGKFTRAHCLDLNSTGARYFKSITLDDIVIENPISAGIACSGGVGSTFGKISLSNIKGWNRAAEPEYVRSDIEVTGGWDHWTMDNIQVTSVEVESNLDPAADSLMLATFNGLSVSQELDINCAGAFDAVKSVTITRSGSTATATVAAHGYQNGDLVKIAGVDQAEYNGYFLISNKTDNTFELSVETFDVSGPATPATGGAMQVRRERNSYPRINYNGLCVEGTLVNLGASAFVTVNGFYIHTNAPFRQVNGGITLMNGTWRMYAAANNDDDRVWQVTSGTAPDYFVAENVRIEADAPGNFWYRYIFSDESSQPMLDEVAFINSQFLIPEARTVRMRGGRLRMWDCTHAFDPDRHNESNKALVVFSGSTRNVPGTRVDLRRNRALHPHAYLLKPRTTQATDEQPIVHWVDDNEMAAPRGTADVHRQLYEMSGTTTFNLIAAPRGGGSFLVFPHVQNVQQAEGVTLDNSGIPKVGVWLRGQRCEYANPLAWGSAGPPVILGYAGCVCTGSGVVGGMPAATFSKYGQLV